MNKTTRHIILMLSILLTALALTYITDSYFNRELKAEPQQDTVITVILHTRFGPDTVKLDSNFEVIELIDMDIKGRE